MALPYTHLSLAGRREIARMHASKIPISVIAERLQQDRSTIYREIKRNWVHDEEPICSQTASADAMAPGCRSGRGPSSVCDGSAAQ